MNDGTHMNTLTSIRQLSWSGGLLTIEWNSGDVSEYASLWLRDNLPENRDAHSGQRLIDVADLPADPQIRSATVEGTTVQVQWADESRTGSFDTGWLAAHANETSDGDLKPRMWLRGSDLEPARDFASTGLADIRNDGAARLRWLTLLLRDGIAFLHDVPAQEPAILDVMSLVGRVCETNYGLVFDVRSVPQPENLAYSDLGLGLHTDNPYREPVPGFQALHALLTSQDGGDSLFADGFALAEHLRDTAPDDFELLTTTAVPFQYRSKGAELQARRPLIQLSCRGEVTAVHYNSRSIAPLRLPARSLDRFYQAYRNFAALLRKPEFQLQYRLRDADLVVFDNQRILHGRTSFSSARYPRHLRGCYLTRDSVYSEAAILRREHDKESV
jgi:alpha-ketoglutarate-dependent taurine dioxygenase